MIELISAERCTLCDLCVDICPTDVFEPRENAPPAIARQEDCQTCYMCEIHCPADAMYVAPRREPAAEGSVHRDESRLAAAGILGSFRARIGWGKGRRPPRTFDEALALARTGPGAGPGPEGMSAPDAAHERGEALPQGALPQGALPHGDEGTADR